MTTCKHCGSETDECLWQEFHDGDAPCGAEFDDELTTIEEPGHIGNARCSAKDLVYRSRQEGYARKLIASYTAKWSI